MEADDVNSDAANFKAQANAAFRSHQDWGPTNFTDPKYHSCVYKGKTFLSGDQMQMCDVCYGKDP